MTKDEELDQLRAEKTALCEALWRKDEELEQSRKANQDLREGLKQAIMAIEYLPDLHLSDLLAGPSGVRAQALAPDGALVDDFIVNHEGGTLHVRNAPSPAATSSLAIAEMIADTAQGAFDFARKPSVK